MKFVKMHGLGNDFVFLEDKNGADKDFSGAPHTGIGADGIIVIVPSDKADVRMRIINADGSEAEMCGNGIRCFAKYVYDNGIIAKKEFAVETLAGIMKPKVTVGDNGKVRLPSTWASPLRIAPRSLWKGRQVRSSMNPSKSTARPITLPACSWGSLIP